MFSGEHYLDQIQKIISVLGMPKENDVEYVHKEEAKEFLIKLAKRSKQTWSLLFPETNPVALDLLGKMLMLKPKKRSMFSASLF